MRKTRGESVVSARKKTPPIIRIKAFVPDVRDEDYDDDGYYATWTLAGTEGEVGPFPGPNEAEKAAETAALKTVTLPAITVVSYYYDDVGSDHEGCHATWTVHVLSVEGQRGSDSGEVGPFDDEDVAVKAAEVQALQAFKFLRKRE